MNPVMCLSRSEFDKRLSTHFKAYEFFCKDGSPVLFIDPELVDLLESVRIKFGKPVIINSGYRTPSYNEKIGGAMLSQHMLGTAADIHIEGVSPAEIAATVDSWIPNSGGIGIYKSFVHVDVREKKSRWKEK
uniref:Murein endopeptidase K n=1 Tax=Dulem virus 189 TaxID=3145666 RepID=A0AAU8AX11_9VIRU